MATIIEITDWALPELEVFAHLTEAQLRNRLEPEKGLFIAESPKVITCALDAGYEPVSFLMEKKHIHGQASGIIGRCGDVPVFTAASDLLAELTGYRLTRGILCAMRRPPLPCVEDLCAGARRVAILENIVDATNIGAIFRSAAALGMDGVTANSLDGVSDRDFAVELAAALSLVMVHLSRFSEEIILWCSWEFKFIELDDAFSTGSSIMPQKKNPDIAELVRGKAGRVFGDLMTLLTVLKGLPLAYNKDMQEDKEAIFDALDTVCMCLTAFIPMVDTMKVLPDNMRRAAAGGFINATDCADYLVGKGLPFRDAYKATGTLVARCIERGLTLETLPLEDYRAVCELFDEGVFEAISLERCAALRRVYGGPAPENVRAQAERVRALAEELAARTDKGRNDL